MLKVCQHMGVRYTWHSNKGGESAAELFCDSPIFPGNLSLWWTSDSDFKLFSGLNNASGAKDQWQTFKCAKHKWSPGWFAVLTADESPKINSSPCKNKCTCITKHDKYQGKLENNSTQRHESPSSPLISSVTNPLQNPVYVLFCRDKCPSNLSVFPVVKDSVVDATKMAWAAVGEQVKEKIQKHILVFVSQTPGVYNLLPSKTQKINRFAKTMQVLLMLQKAKAVCVVFQSGILSEGTLSFAWHKRILTFANPSRNKISQNRSEISVLQDLALGERETCARPHMHQVTFWWTRLVCGVWFWNVPCPVCPETMKKYIPISAIPENAGSPHHFPLHAKWINPYEMCVHNPLRAAGGSHCLIALSSCSVSTLNSEWGTHGRILHTEDSNKRTEVCKCVYTCAGMRNGKMPYLCRTERARFSGSYSLVPCKRDSLSQHGEVQRMLVWSFGWFLQKVALVWSIWRSQFLTE